MLQPAFDAAARIEAERNTGFSVQILPVHHTYSRCLQAHTPTCDMLQPALDAAAEHRSGFRVQALPAPVLLTCDVLQPALDVAARVEAERNTGFGV